MRLLTTGDDVDLVRFRNSLLAWNNNKNPDIDTTANRHGTEYIRQMIVKKNTLIVGHYHAQQSAWAITEGRMLLRELGHKARVIKTGDSGESPTHSFKIGLVLEDTLFISAHIIPEDVPLGTEEWYLQTGQLLQGELV